MISDADHQELDERRREIRKLGWISGIACAAFVICSFLVRTAGHTHHGSDVPFYLGAALVVVSLVVLVWATARRLSRVKTYNAMILAKDPRLSGDHIPIAKK